MSSHPQNSARSALLEERARVMRAAPTLSEARLWHHLAGSRLLGVSFRRQVVIGPYIVDFLAPAARLVVEVDGAYHARRSRADARRDARLAVLGYRVLPGG
jgi:very-short-patch-repair endonuclease